MGMQYIKMDDQTVRVGSIIMERHQQSTARKVLSINGFYVTAEGVESRKVTTIKNENMRRYDVVAESR